MNGTVLFIMMFLGWIILIIGLLMMFSTPSPSAIRRLHIADLEYMLGQLNAEKSELDAEIASVHKQLSDARATEYEIRKRQGEYIDMTDRQFNDILTRGY